MNRPEGGEEVGREGGNGDELESFFQFAFQDTHNQKPTPHPSFPPFLPPSLPFSLPPFLLTNKSRADRIEALTTRVRHVAVVVHVNGVAHLDLQRLAAGRHEIAEGGEGGREGGREGA